MKKILLAALLVLASYSANAQWVAIPDYDFGRYLKLKFPTCIQIDTIQFTAQIDTTCAASSLVKRLELENGPNSVLGISFNDGNGLQYFKNIDTLIVSDAYLFTYYSITFPPNLKYLALGDISENFPFSSPYSFISCSVPSLPSFPNSLKVLRFSSDPNFSPLTTLPVLPPNLEEIALGYLQIQYPSFPNSLKKIIITHCNMSGSINSLPSNLEHLELININTKNILALPSSTKKLSISSDSLVSLPFLPTGLKKLYCRTSGGGQNNNGLLTVIPNIPDSLKELGFEGQPIYCIPPIKNNLDVFNPSSFLRCVPNYFLVSGAPVSKPICDPIKGCDFYYNISGDVYKNISTNCSIDSTNPGPSISNIKLTLKKNGSTLSQMYSTPNGKYSFWTPTFSTHTVEVDTTNLPFMVSCPIGNSRAVPLTTTDTVFFNQNFALKCKGNDWGLISIYGDRFRPTRTTLVEINAGDYTKLKYNISCASASSGTVKTILPSNLKYVQPAVGALTPTVLGNTLTYTVSDLTALKSGDLHIIVKTDSNTVAGSSVCIASVIKSNSVDINVGNDSLTQCFQVVNSYDPNLKEVTPTVITQGNSWLTYTIHFQNTGTDTAHDIIVKDTLSNLLNTASFEFVAASHSNKIIQLNGNNLSVTFPNINLLDSLHNEPKSHGWFQFKIKTTTNLPTNTTISNKAFIYFDNNAPIVTNTAYTERKSGIDNVIRIPITAFPNPFDENFTIQTTQEGKYTIQVVDLIGNNIYSGEFTNFKTIDLSKHTAGNYIVKISDQLGNTEFIKLLKK